jgi:hypothetical protein
VLAAGVSIAVLWGAGVAWRRATPPAQALASFQASAFVGLDARAQGIFSDLQAAEAEIRALQRETSEWPEPNALAASGVPPFVGDAAWAARGRHSWQRLDAHSPTHAVYWGRNATEEWALVLSGESAAVWRREAKPEGAIPQAIPEMLVLDGWTEFVPRRAGT